MASSCRRWVRETPPPRPAPLPLTPCCSRPIPTPLPPPQVFSAHGGVVRAGLFSPDGKAVVSVGGEGDASLRVWNPKTGECTLTLQGNHFHEGGAWGGCACACGCLGVRSCPSEAGGEEQVCRS